jgi:hypothetical protein
MFLLDVSSGAWAHLLKRQKPPFRFSLKKNPRRIQVDPKG